MTPEQIRKLADRVQYYPADARKTLLACADVVEVMKEYINADPVDRTTYGMRQALARLEAIKP